MPATPDRRPGSLDEEEILLDANPGTPSAAGGIRYSGAIFQMRDATGTFDPRVGGAGLTSNDFLLDNEPVTPNTTYAPTYTSGKVTEELWTKTTGGQAIRRVTYTYSGNRVSTEVRKVYAADGTTVVAQVTWTYSYTGGVLTGATMTRDV